MRKKSISSSSFFGLPSLFGLLFDSISLKTTSRRDRKNHIFNPNIYFDKPT